MCNLKQIYKTVLIPVIFIIFFTGINSITFASNKSEALAQRVSDAIANHYDEYFDVSANNKGDVRIEGQVNSLYDKYNIFDIVERVRGVKGISDFISVDTPVLPDDIIKANLENELRLDKSILEPNRIKVQVTNGIIILGGTVSYYREKLLAETIASWQKGAVGIVNQIKILPQKTAVSDWNLSIIIKNLLRDHFPLDKKIHYYVKDGIVTLTGYSHNMWVNDHLQKDCLKIEGVKKVINKIKTAPEEYPDLL